MPSSHLPVHPDSESHFRQIVDSAVDYAIVSCDAQGRVRAWSEGAHLLLGWTAQEMQGQTLHRIFTPEDREAATPEHELATVAQQGRATDERWHLRRSGERFWASGEMVPLRDPDGAVAGYVKILRDQTAQHLHEDELRELNETLRGSEARLQMAVEAGGMGVWQADLRTGEPIWWPGMEAVHGLPPGSPALPMGQYYALVHPDDQARLADALAQVRGGGGTRRVEYRVIWPDGRVRWLESRGHLIHDAQGTAVAMAGVCLDINRRKLHEHDLAFLAQASAELANLSEHEATLARIAQLAVPGFADWCAIDLLEDDGTVRRVATACVDADQHAAAAGLRLQLPADPRPHGSTWRVLHGGRGALVSDLDATVLDPLPTATAAAVRSLGLRSYVAAPLAVRGRTLGALAFGTASAGRRYGADDLALAEELGRRAAVAVENAKLLHALQQADRAKDVFLATLAHELRNPLAPIWNGLSIIRRVPGDAARVEQIADVIERQVGQLSRLVDDLLDVSRISTGKIELKKVPTNLVHILGHAVEMSRPHIEAAHHKLSLAFPEDGTEVYADPVRMAQVFSNLLNNAAKYTRRGGRIDVVVETLPDRVMVRVRDNGTGIAPEMLAQVFGLFTQVMQPDERRQGGLGIGLSLVEGLVRLHGGRVEARSDGIDRGSEFVVSLPRLLRDGTQSLPPAMREPAFRHVPPALMRRMLVVDDNADTASTVAQLLSMSGNEVDVVHDGGSAVSRTADFRPDVVLLDIGLPDISGYEVARRIRKLEGVRQPVLIALTGWGQQQDKQAAAQAGFDHHWTKPVDPARLEELSSR